MLAVFVHGVPDTHHVWHALLEHLDRRDVLVPDLPGFGCPQPEGFTPTKEGYLEWLTEEVEALGEPVDLVGHDWGALLVQRLACVRPDLVRTWASGSVAIDPEYEWHAMATVWQTPGAGEQAMELMAGEGLVAGLVGLGVPEDHAAAAAVRVDDTMRHCILELYRSAVDVFEQWAPDLDDAPPRALVLWGGDDPIVPHRYATRFAERVDGEVVVFEGSGHWWPLERPREAARVLERLWSDPVR